MIRILVLYPARPGARFDMDYYLSHHIPLCRELGAPMGARIEVDRGIGTLPAGEAPFVAVAHISFRTHAALQDYLESHGPRILADVPNYTDIQPIFQVSEVAG